MPREFISEKETASASSAASCATLTDVVRDMPRVRAMLEHGPVQITSHKRNEFVMVPQSQFERMSSLSNVEVIDIDEKLRLVLDTVSTFILIMDEALRVRRANKTFMDYFGCEDGDVVGRQFGNLAKTANDNYVLICAQQVLESGQEKRFDLASSHREGRFFRYVIRPWPGGVAIFADDITEQFRATENIMQELARDQASKELGGVGSGVVDASGTILRASLGLAVLLGVKRRVLIDASIHRVLSPGSREHVERCLERRGLETETIDIEYLTDGAELAPARMICSPFSSGRYQNCSAFIIQDRARYGERPKSTQGG